MSTVWSLLVSGVCAAFLQVFPAQFETRGTTLMVHVSAYGLCVMTRAVEMYFPDAFCLSLNFFFVNGIQAGMLLRQCTVPALVASEFSIFSKMIRIILAIGTSNRSHVVIWNVLFAITGCHKGLTFMYDSFALDAALKLEPTIFYRKVSTIVGSELLCSVFILVIRLATEKFMALVVAAMLEAQESENEKVAAQRMLAVLCDSQMMLDSELRISGRHESSARFLQVPATAGRESLDGVDFTEFVDPVDVSRFLAFMRGHPSWASGRPESPEASPDEEREPRRQGSKPRPAGSLHVQMFNGLRRPFKAELFHVCFKSGGTVAHLVGIREENQHEGEAPSKLEADLQDGHAANETGEASELFDARLLNDCVRKVGERAECKREEEDEEEVEENSQVRVTMRPFETGDLLKLGSAASERSSSSASSSCASKAVPMFPGLQDVVACLSPFSPCLAMNSCQVNFLSPEGDICLGLKDFVSATELQRVFLIIQQMVNCALNGDLMQKTDLGPLKLKLPGTRECDGLTFLAKSAELSVSVKDPSETDTSNEDGSDEDSDGSKDSLELNDGPGGDSDRRSGPRGGGGGGGGGGGASSFGCRQTGGKPTARPAGGQDGGVEERIRVTLRLRELSIPTDTSKGSSRRRRRRVMECLREPQNVQLAACMLPIIEEAWAT
ncbi:unnamed protein product [Polarella glacialis]|uniref:Uncharacterized protein n=1 Tax=Polarella glacialis TaxID=89957 RepID=A0A813FTS9_POLGL|nr:unnamed protein product [Polarella glacialis]